MRSRRRWFWWVPLAVFGTAAVEKARHEIVDIEERPAPPTYRTSSETICSLVGCIFPASPMHSNRLNSAKCRVSPSLACAIMEPMAIPGHRRVDDCKSAVDAHQEVVRSIQAQRIISNARNQLLQTEKVTWIPRWPYVTTKQLQKDPDSDGTDHTYSTAVATCCLGPVLKGHTDLQPVRRNHLTTPTTLPLRQLTTNARNAAHDAAAATRSGKTPARLAPATKETRLTMQRSKQLPPSPPNAIRVVVRPRGELRLLDVPTPRLTKAVQTQLRISLPDDFCLHTHPTNNTFTMATTHLPTAETLKTLTSLAIGDQTYPCTAYVAPPPGATKGVITNAYDDETPTQLYQDRRNPEYTILAARRMGKTHSILITFDANSVPHSIKYMRAIHRCTLYRGSPDAFTNCRQPGHRHDVCPSPKTNISPRCGTQHSQQHLPSTPKCILCEGPHLTGTGSCKGRNLHQPRKQPSHPETQQEESAPPRDIFSQLSSGPTQPNQHKTRQRRPQQKLHQPEQKPPLFGNASPNWKPRPPRGSTFTKWDSFRSCKAARTVILITDITDWTAQATQLTPASCIYGKLKQALNDAGKGSAGTEHLDAASPVSTKR
ncbi:hypothetical protein HPB49_022879 [Dermacentor silvarum]|uniref:Uncharacterized protein n=1 Tax=Dermacentor silvarum TaxID=543639 RepID=A0ACB8CBP4_DERSI|nr:hypothetical protein HPB49_022879 [Dermacentor silvarum]